ncbi:MAG: gamma carbonic anhydrase family protein [Planctomycetota bacterium]|jgi:carbonic anhydrase/acetyltransferase-like protein (isoleucine patch superfamily)
MMMQDRGGWFAAYNALVTGAVEIGEESSVWFQTTVRGDDAAIRIGKRVNLQDFTMVHPDPGEDLIVGDDVIVGHRAILHNRWIGSRTVIGMGAILLPRARIGESCIVAAGALVPEGMVVEDGWVVMGIPARPVRQITDEDRAYVEKWVPHYVEAARQYCRRALPSPPG